MFVYIIKFENSPNLIKIGKSVCPDDRVAQLSKTHGYILYKEFYEVGVDYSRVEKMLHKRFKSFRVQIDGEGGTEFFCDSTINEVSTFLSTYNPTKKLSYDLQMEEIRYHNLIGKLLGHYGEGGYTGKNSLYSGWNDIITMNGCVDLGFDEDVVFQKMAEKKPEHWLRKRFTTKNRVGMAYRLAKEGSTKYQELRTLCA